MKKRNDAPKKEREKKEENECDHEKWKDENECEHENEKKKMNARLVPMVN